MYVFTRTYTEECILELDSAQMTAVISVEYPENKLIGKANRGIYCRHAAKLQIVDNSDRKR